MTDKELENLKDIYVSALLHDTGKYIQKYIGRNGKHQILSEIFVLKNPNICIGQDVHKIANIIVRHHKLDEINITDYSKYEISYNSYVSQKDLKIASDVFALNNFSDEIKIIQKADSFSASSDRASETGSDKSAAPPFAPLISPIGQIVGKRLFIKHGKEYIAEEFEGKDDNKETVEKNQSNFENAITESFKEFCERVNSLKDCSISDLDEFLKEFWFSVNANTWRPKGQSLCNTTTSLYDHSKTTAAIAACIYINYLNGYSIPSDSDSCANIDVLHFISNGNSLDMEDIIYDLFDELNLYSPNIISITKQEAYIMIPTSLFKKANEFIYTKNKEIFEDFGETLNVEIYSNWQFKKCNKSLKDRKTSTFIGILNVNLERKDSIDTEYFSNFYKDKIISGYSVNNFKRIIDEVIVNNDSISKLSTTFRIFEKFLLDVENLLGKNNCEVIYAGLDRCIFSIDKNILFKIQLDIHKLFEKYVYDTVGLSFTYAEFNKYTNTIENIDLYLIQREFIFDNFDDKSCKTTIFINNKILYIESLPVLFRFVDKYKNVSSGCLYKVLRLLDEAFLFNEDKDFKHLVSRSRLNYLKTKETNELNILFIDDIYNNFFKKNDYPKLNSKLDIYYEGIKEILKKGVK